MTVEKRGKRAFRGEDVGVHPNLQTHASRGAPGASQLRVWAPLLRGTWAVVSHSVIPPSPIHHCTLYSGGEGLVTSWPLVTLQCLAGGVG